jgi:hypothetical protein
MGFMARLHANREMRGELAKIRRDIKALNPEDARNVLHDSMDRLNKVILMRAKYIAASGKEMSWLTGVQFRRTETMLAKQTVKWHIYEGDAHP